VAERGEEASLASCDPLSPIQRKKVRFYSWKEEKEESFNRANVPILPSSQKKSYFSLCNRKELEVEVDSRLIMKGRKVKD